MARFCSFMSVVGAFVLTSSSLLACPFCSAVSQTFSEEMKMMDVVVLTELQSVAKVSSIDADDPDAEIPKSTFKVTDVLKGDKFIKVGDTFEMVYFGEAKKDRAFLAMATDAPNLAWSTPLILTERAEAYLGKIKALPESAERLEFFQDHLEDEDEMLARDAYDEFAKAPYDAVIALKPKMKREQLLEFIQNPDVPSNRRRLYFTMLGVCGTGEDAKLLETFMQSGDRKVKAGLDSMLACYIILSGEPGLGKVDELFLKNKKAEYADTYAAIMAIRFHGSETDVIPKTRLTKSLRHMLDRPELADLVIPDLARWEDWEVLPKLTELFVSADENSSWVRVPVINYLRACPLPIAAEKIEELKLVDADSVKRAMTFFPLTPDSKDENEKSSDESETEEASDSNKQPTTSTAKESTATEQSTSANGEVPTAEINSRSLGGKIGGNDSDVAQTQLAASQVTAQTTKNALQRRLSSNSGTSISTPETLNEIETRESEGMNVWQLLGVTIIAGGLCFVTMRTIIGPGTRA